MTIREETAGDMAGIRAVVAAAFGRPDEANLVDTLRADGEGVISLVAAEGSSIVGHVLFSRMTAPLPALGMAPVSVAPHCQRSGVGSALIREGLARAQQQGFAAVFVLGDPAYYRRFGFDPDLARGFDCVYAGTHFMVLPLAERLLVTTGAVSYAPAFATPG